jgi:transposase
MQKNTSLDRSGPVLGLDVAQASFVAVLCVDATHSVRASFPNHAGGFTRLQTWLHQHFSGLVRAGLEATGVYSRDLAQWLHDQHPIVHLLNPARVAAYARAVGQRNKTDPADAGLIAAYVRGHALPVWHPPSPAHATLQALTRCRAQLESHRQALRNEQHCALPATARFYAQLLTALAQQLGQIEQAIQEHLRESPDLGTQVRRLDTIPGIGEKTATVVVAELPPISPDSDPRALSAWAGLCPCRRQSGQWQGRSRLGRAGNVYLRRALYMPSLVAKRYNPRLRAFALRLASQSHHTHGAILGALSHKLLRIMIGLLRHQQDYDPNLYREKS